MPTFMVKTPAFLFPSLPATAGDHPVLKKGQRFDGIAEGFFIKTTIDTKTGFVDFEAARELPSIVEPVPEGNGAELFCALATMAARREKSDRDYLVASAYFLSKKLTDFGKVKDARIGPFRFSEAEWRAGEAAAKKEDPRVEYGLFEIFDWRSQISVAATRSAAAIKSFADSVKRLPVPHELFFMERLALEGPALVERLTSDKTCKDAFPGATAGSFAADIADAGNKPFKTFVDEIQQGLRNGYAESREAVGKLPPHLFFFRDEDWAPWLAVANLLKGKGLDTSTDALAAELKASFLGGGARSAVFAGFCLKFSGVQAAKDSVLDNVGDPASWKNWAKPAPEPAPPGSVVVTKPPVGGKATVGILAAPAAGDDHQVYVCSDAGSIDVEVKTIAKGSIDVMRWLDLSEVAAGLAGGDMMLGELSRVYESGNRGPGVVSSGTGDAGGVSYGSYQMTSRPGGGTVRTFVSDATFTFRDRFVGLQPGTTEFTDAWTRLAAEQPAKFQAEQHNFIKRTHYDPVVDAVNALGINITMRSAALKDCCWSTGVQHGAGGGPAIVRAIVQAVLAQGDPAPATGKPFDEAVIRGVYAERGRRDGDGQLHHFRRNSRDVQESVAKRFVNELNDALAMLKRA